jgi:hypothetical protein
MLCRHLQDLGHAAAAARRVQGVIAQHALECLETAMDAQGF